MAGISLQLFFLSLVGIVLRADGKNVATPRLHFPSENFFQTRVLYDDGDQLDLNVTQSDYVGFIAAYSTADLKNWPGIACARECMENEPRRICWFDWTLEFWNVMGPACGNCQNGVISDCYNESCIFLDGVERGVLAINRQIPGPPIHVCKNDVIVVDVKNRMAGNDESIHWHGILQRNTPWMDGVAYVTQCPIRSDNTMRYAFEVSKYDTGTMYYHSHTGHHKVNGIFGALVVHDTRKNDPNARTYECDHPANTILISDWFHTPAENLVPGLQNTSQIPKTYLLNGRGRYFDPMTGKRTYVPLAVFRMNPSKCRSNRFRVINSDSSVCPVQFQIEQHRLRVIATDSYSIEPTEVDSIFSAAGERFDFVLPTVKPGPGNEYWISVMGTGICQGQNIRQFAVLSYADESVTNEQLALPTRPFPDEFPRGITLNRANTMCGGRDYCPSDLQDAEPILTKEEKNRLIRQEADVQIVIPFNNYALSNKEAFHYLIFHHILNIGKLTFVGAIDNITLAFPHISLDTQPEDIVDDGGDIDRQTFCDKRHLPTRCNGLAQCPCTHREKFAKGSVVDLIMVDDTRQQTSLSHPFHLHGHGFYVTNQYNARPDQPLSGEIVREALRDGTFYQRFGQVRRKGINYGNPAKKDTTQIPSKGLVVLRVLFDNPGFWLMHCHIDWHLGIGMAFIIQVGELNEMKPRPDNFPICRDYKPTVVLD